MEEREKLPLQGIWCFWVAVALVLTVPNLCYLWGSETSGPRSWGTPFQKTKFLELHGQEYNVLILGDSKAYCGIDPLILDRKLRSHSLNLAGWGNAFPSIYTQILSVVEHTPPSTKLVWLISGENFVPSEINQGFPYPPSFSSVVALLSLGMRWDQLRGPMVVSGLGTGVLRAVPGSYLLTNRETLKEHLGLGSMSEICEDSLGYDPLRAEGEQLLEKARGDSDIILSRLKLSNCKVTSAEFYLRAGNYHRVVLDDLFFLDVKRDALLQLRLEQPTPEASPNREQLRNIFMMASTRLASHGGGVFVAWVSAAPSYYNSTFLRERDQAYFSWTKEKLGEIGVALLDLRAAPLEESDFFDVFHVTREGSRKLSEYLAAMLAHQIQKT